MSRFYLIGFMGSGKTTLGKLVSEKMGYSFIDMDKLIEANEHSTIRDIFANKGEEEFRKLEQNYLYKTGQYKETIIATGGGMPCFFENMDFMKKNGKTIYIKLTPEQLKKRLEYSRQNTRPLLEERQGEDLLGFISSKLQSREIFYNQADYSVEGDDFDIIEQIISIVLNNK